MVSGAAEGVDQSCLQAAMEESGRAWAFMGCGLDRLGESQRRFWEKYMCKGGAYFSEYPPGAGADKTTFPRRNRLISAAADAVVVLRAPQKSGSLHTARYAMGQRRPLWAVPGHPGNEGAMALLRYGEARPAHSPEEIAAAMGLGPLPPSPGPPPLLEATAPLVAPVLSPVLSPSPRAPVPRPSPRELKGILLEAPEASGEERKKLAKAWWGMWEGSEREGGEEGGVEASNPLEEGAKPVMSPSPLESSPPGGVEEPLSEEALRVLEKLAGVSLFEDLLAATHMDSASLSAVLCELELGGRVVQKPGKRYERV